MIDRTTAARKDLNMLPSSVSAWQTHTPLTCMHSRDIQAFIGDDLLQVEALIRSATTSRYAEVERLCRAASAMGGKRLRPSLVILAARACATDPISHRQHVDLLAIASSVELVHAASLVHDDVLDGATQRRHQSTIYSSCGNATAVLLGDYLFTRAYALAAQCQSTFPARRIAASATKLCAGELRQQASAGNWSLSRADYRSLLLQKTGALCAVSCQLGGWRMGADRRQTNALRDFGNLLGLAFQIYDDWLDYWGTEQVGKTLGTDCDQRKPTLPLIRLFETTAPAQKLHLQELLRAGGSDASMKIRRELDRSDAADFTMRVAIRCVEQAKSKLVALPASAAKDCLLAVAEYSVRRVQ